MSVPAILVVSSDATWRRQIADRLLLANYVVYCARDTREACGFLRDGLRAAAVVMDACNEGLERFRLERSQDDRLRATPVVALVDGRPQVDQVVALDRTWAFAPLPYMEAALERLLGPPPGPDPAAA